MPPGKNEPHDSNPPIAGRVGFVHISGAPSYTGAMPASRLSLRRTFVADHFHDLPGFLEARHGHNWELEATVMACPEPTLVQALDAWVAQVDYTLLNEQTWMEGRNPTAEALAQWLLEFLESRGFKAVEARLREKANYWAACRRDFE